MATDEYLSAGLELPWAFEDHHIEWQKIVRSFAHKEVEPDAGRRTWNARGDNKLIAAAAELGLFGLLIPDSSGGTGADLRTLCLSLEELAAVDVSFASTLHVQAVGAALLAHLAGADSAEGADILPQAAHGEAFISFGLTEPSMGSDAAAMKARATEKGNGWVLSGSKQFISNSGTSLSKYIIVFARSEGSTAEPEYSAFLVPLDTPGVTVGPSYDKFGWRSADTHPVYFDDVQLPESALLGRRGDGLREALSFLTWARIPVSAVGTGVIRGCLREAHDYVANRSVFGKSLSHYQNTALQIADLAAKASTARLLTYDAAWKYDRGLSFDRDAAIAKLTTSEMANQAAYVATQLEGGYGVVGDGIAARAYQDARILTIVEGTSEVQRLLIARSLGVEAFK
jgi:short/branched chain acyl-CoA dehydrogenase